LNQVIVVNGRCIKQNILVDKEILLGEFLYSPYIVNAMEIIDDVNHDHVYFIMELCEGELCP